jgi:hypothetical protein
MKTSKYIWTIGLLGVLASCSDDMSEMVSPVEQGITRIYATIGDDMADTRTMLVNDKKIFWEVGDKIGVIPTGDFSQGWYNFTYQNDGYFNGGDATGVGTAGTYFAAYPSILHAKDDTKQLLMKLDKEVKYKENSFSQPMPMFAGSTNLPSGQLTFYPAAGVIKVALAGSFKVTKITLEGNNHEQITGVGLLNTADAKPSLEMSPLIWTIISDKGSTEYVPGYQQVMTMDDGVQLTESPTSFYFVVAPTDFTKGITITVEGDGLSHPIVKTTASDVKVERGAMKAFTSVDISAIMQEEAATQLDALKAMYYSLDGANWTKKWDLSKPLSEVAAWPGVTADANGLVTKIDLSNNGLKGTLPAEIGNLTLLQDINLSGNNITGGIPKEVKGLDLLQKFYIDGNQMNDSVPYVVYTSDVWGYADKKLTQQSGYALKTKYVSNDYSKDGYNERIYTHTVGPGIPVVITCEAFTDDMVEEFNTQATKAMNYFFSIAPYKDFQEYFDVYRMMSVSPNDEVGLNLPYGVRYDGDTYHIETDKVRKKIEDKLGLSTNNLLSIVLLNEKNTAKRARCYYISDGFAAAIAPVDDDLECIIHHEAGGHGFAFLADEYSSDGDKSYGAAERADLDQRHSLGWSLNLSYNNTNTTVPWKGFWTDAAYAPEAVGAYEGGDAAYKFGVYRSTDKSTMNSQYEFDKFNPQSRWLIYQQICNRAGLACTLEAFKAYDAANITSLPPAVSVVTRNYVEKKEHKLGAPPVYIIK